MNAQSLSMVFLVVSVAAAQSPPKQPNIILIMADDIGFECLGAYGSRQYRTPHLDRLASEGLRFQHCYSQPLCTPSRVKLMTGLSNVRNYAAFSILRSDQRTIGHLFQKAGYATAVAGKWQLLGAVHYDKRFRGKGTRPRAAGFDSHCLWQVDQLGKRYWNPLLHINGTNKQFKRNDYGPAIATDFIIEFMTAQAKAGKPFFAYYPMILPHNPFLPTPLSSKRESRNKQRNFEDMVTYIDHLVGRIVAATKKLKIDGNTLVLFCGDNGTNKAIRSRLGDDIIQGGKALPTDAGTRVPMIASWPGVVPVGKTLNDLIDFSDFLPTCLEASGIKVPEGLDGQSFWPQLQGKRGSPRESIFCYYCPRPEKTAPIRFARNRRFKLYGNGRFFDVHKDILEQHPLTDLQGLTTARSARDRLQKTLDAMPSVGQALLKFK